MPLVKRLITDIPLSEMPAFMEGMGIKRYAAGQVIQWLYQKRVQDVGEMTNLSKAVRERLAAEFDIQALDLVESISAADGTTKYLCRARDGKCVECVLIPADDERWTACLSTQVGCQMGCAFCRTARMGFERDLSMGEIISELILMMRNAKRDVTNVVFMGMGEPLMNMDAVGHAIEALTAEGAFGMSKKRITVSTAGLIPELREFTSRYDVKVAISLNATDDATRDRIMPINKKYPIAAIMDFCREYSKRSKSRVTFEYVMMDGVNDSEADARRLACLISGFKAKVNLIPFNAFEGSGFSPSRPEIVMWWSDFLYGKGIQTNIRVSRGQEILAACGQLAANKRQ
jgi:23S rRNA (adenine2503-C2)-methyltransferase